MRLVTFGDLNALDSPPPLRAANDHKKLTAGGMELGSGVLLPLGVRARATRDRGCKGAMLLGHKSARRPHQRGSVRYLWGGVTTAWVAVQRLAILLHGPSPNKGRELLGEWPAALQVTRDSSNRLLGSPASPPGQLLESGFSRIVQERHAKKPK